MALISDHALVLRRLDYSETSQVLAVFTREHGQQRVIAKGIKRSTKTRVAVGVDLLERGQIVFSRRPGHEDSLATLTEWRQEDNYAHLRRDLRSFYAAQYAAEAVSRLTEVNDPHPALFDGLGAAFGAFDGPSALATLNAFVWLLLREIGLRPEMAACVGCGREIEGEKVLYHSAREGGVLCRDCEPSVATKRRAAPAAVRALATDRAAEPAVAAGVFDLLDFHLTEMLSGPLKLSAPLRSAVGPARR